MDIILSNSSDKPIYEQISSQVKAQILSGTLAAGAKLPSIRTLASDLGVSVITTKRAYADLEAQGFIETVQGKGSFVAHKETDMQLNHLYGFSDEMRRLGRVPSTQLLGQQILVPGDRIAHALMLAPGQKVHVFERLRFADAVPMALEKVHLPFHRFPGLKAQDVTASLYKLLSKEYGCERSRAEQSIRADAADRHAAKALELKSGMPVLRITRVTFDHSGVPFEYVESIYRGDKYVFNVSLGL